MPFFFEISFVSVFCFTVSAALRCACSFVLSYWLFCFFAVFLVYCYFLVSVLVGWFVCLPVCLISLPLRECDWLKATHNLVSTLIFTKFYLTRGKLTALSFYRVECI